MSPQLVFVDSGPSVRSISSDEIEQIDREISEWREQFRALSAEMQGITAEDLRIRVD